MEPLKPVCVAQIRRFSGVSLFEIVVRHLDPFYDYTASESVAISPSGQLIATGSISGFVYIWDVNNGTIIAQYEHRSAVTSVKFTPDHSKVISGGKDGTIKFWDIRGAVGIASGGSLFLTDSDKTVSLEGHMVRTYKLRIRKYSKNGSRVRSMQ